MNASLLLPLDIFEGINIKTVYLVRDEDKNIEYGVSSLELYNEIMSTRSWRQKGKDVANDSIKIIDTPSPTGKIYFYYNQYTVKLTPDHTLIFMNRVQELPSRAEINNIYTLEGLSDGYGVLTQAMDRNEITGEIEEINVLVRVPVFKNYITEFDPEQIACKLAIDYVNEYEKYFEEGAYQCMMEYNNDLRNMMAKFNKY